ncbi:hypothetical protein AMTR_s00118p00138550 [Amborella trichopoda]|uniref:Uncharacterized protein n=1 Tax=Amborella trichopoda TaxID=13333 RepID=W1NQT7_AMBTC|nr:hypothetical protein AMTR_s00118p00138550 [Amborella trichopoda]
MESNLDKTKTNELMDYELAIECPKFQGVPLVPMDASRAVQVHGPPRLAWHWAPFGWHFVAFDPGLGPAIFGPSEEPLLGMSPDKKFV